MKTQIFSHVKEDILRFVRDPLGFEFPISLELHEGELPSLERPLVSA